MDTLREGQLGRLGTTGFKVGEINREMKLSETWVDAPVFGTLAHRLSIVQYGYSVAPRYSTRQAVVHTQCSTLSGGTCHAII